LAAAAAACLPVVAVVIAAYEPILVGDRGDTALGRKMLAAELDYTRAEMRPEVKEKFVWHGVVSVDAEEGQLSDEQWQDIAATITDHLGFNSDSESDVRWIAVHHGQSRGGNDHIHLVANLINEDGRKHKFVRPPGVMMGEVRKQLEIKHGLRLVGHDKGSGLGDYPQLDVRRAAEAHRAAADTKGVTLSAVPGVEPGTVRLERSVRAAAAAATGEAEFLSLLGKEKVLVRPRFATGDAGTVVGDTFALPSRDGESLSWRGGGRLAKDLTLPALRARWSESVEEQAAAVQVWHTLGAVPQPRGNRLAPATAATRDPEPDFAAAIADIDRLGEFAKTVGAGNPEAAREAAREAAAVLSAAALRTEGRAGGAVASAGRRMARCAQQDGPVLRETIRAVGVPRMNAASALLLNAATGKSHQAGWVAVIHSLARTANTVAAAQRAQTAAQWEVAAATAAAVNVAAFAARLDGLTATPNAQQGGDRPVLTERQQRMRDVMVGQRTKTIDEIVDTAANTPARSDRTGVTGRKPDTGRGRGPR